MNTDYQATSLMRQVRYHQMRNDRQSRNRTVRGTGRNAYYRNPGAFDANTGPARRRNDHAAYAEHTNTSGPSVAGRYGRDLYVGRRPRPRMLIPLISIAFALAVMLLSYTLITNWLHAPWAGTDNQNNLLASVFSSSPLRESPKSTPKDQWKKGTMPHLYQTDAQWADREYGSGTIGDSGCGPTSLSMVYVYLTGKTDKDPASMCAYSQLNGFVDGDLTTWTFMSEGATGLGLTSREVPADKDSLVAELDAGNPVIVTVGKGDFTDSGHFMVLAGLDENGKLIIFDPNSKENSEKTWDIERVLPQCRNIWAFTA